MNKISVVIPTFDRPDMLPETLRLLTRQSVAPQEVLIVDNGTTPTVLESSDYPFTVRYFRICAMAGAAQARNFGVAMAEGRYVAFLDDDDYWESDYIERLSRIVTNDALEAPAMIVARVDHLDKGERRFFRFAGNAKGANLCFYFNPGYVGSSITVEKSTFLKLGGFDTLFRTGEDKELAIRYMVKGLRIHYDADLIAVNRVHQHSLSRHIDYLQDARLLLRKYKTYVGFRLRVRTLREAYKKSRKKRYAIHKLVLRVVLAATSFRANAR